MLMVMIRGLPRLKLLSICSYHNAIYWELGYVLEEYNKFIPR